MRTQELTQGRWVTIRLDAGEDLLDGIRRGAAAEGVANGVVLSGVGSLSRFRVHVVGSPVLPTHDEYVTGEGPFDILQVTGLIVEGRVHAHVAFADTQRAMGGHLEEGCRVLTFAAVTLVATPDADLRDWDRVGALR